MRGLCLLCGFPLDFFPKIGYTGSRPPKGSEDMEHTQPKKTAKEPKKPTVGRCEECEFYDYDEDLDAYVCQVNLDEDEMISFISGQTGRCPYYRYYDEYKSVHKQI
jgi:hypothetical protein